MPVLELRPAGLYCPAGDFYIDPHRSVERAVITHAHSDHARRGMGSYLCSETCEPLLRARLGQKISVEGLSFGHSRTLGGARVSLHPAGHILGSAQVRVEVGGEVWVASGDYKVEPDPVAEAFEPVACHTFITEATFAMPVYRWRPEHEVVSEMVSWLAHNQGSGVVSVLYAYSLGKAQRLLASLAGLWMPIWAHPAVIEMNRACAEAGADLPELVSIADAPPGPGIVISPPGSMLSDWLVRRGPWAGAWVSGWMALESGSRRRQGAGFALSDHADWPGLLQAVKATGAERVYCTHGYEEPLARFLRESLGLDAHPLARLASHSLEHGGG
jgi:putative mRNA 3-end processing factor